MPQTLDEIRRRGLEALRRELGPAGFVRFLQQFETGHGDYAKSRRTWVDETSLEDLRQLSSLASSRKKSGKAKKSGSTPGQSE